MENNYSTTLKQTEESGNSSIRSDAGDSSKTPRQSPEGTLQISTKTIRKSAQNKNVGNNLLWIALRQAFYENWLKIRKQVSFRSRQNKTVQEAYCAMTEKEFDGINARQSWSNWRTVPTNLNGRLPNRPVRAIDLCCGVGQSTQVLAHYLPAGSQILGLEFNPSFVAFAQKQKFYHADGSLTSVQFRAQSVLETFCELNDQPIENTSVDLVNCCGAVGAHFDVASTQKLAQEVSRVLKPNGLATIDSGPEGTSKEDLILIFEKLGFIVLNQTKSCFLDRFTQICFQKKG